MLGTAGLLICALGVTQSLSAARIVTTKSAYSSPGQSAEQIEEWLNKNLNPGLYDIWHDRKQRVSLNGAWKIAKLDTKDHKDQTGEQAGFWKPEFDDTEWFNQPVLWTDGNLFPSANYTTDRRREAGIQWYRKRFSLPAGYRGKRVILHFDEVAMDAVIWVNGKKAGENCGIFGGHCSDMMRRRDAFEFDVTDLVHFDKENVVAVRSSQ